jgi:SAM-dependent methyltransferase
LSIRFCYDQFRSFLFDPRQIVNNWRALPYFVLNGLQYGRLNRSQNFRIRLRDLLCCSGERFQKAGSARGHYFWQDVWAARFLYANNVRKHIDIASRLDGFVAHILPFCQVVYVDLRPLPSEVEGLEFRQGSLLSLPFADDSVRSLSCLHVVEHIGLGRYGDAIDPEGHRKAAKELVRVLAPGGVLLLGTPVGQERLCFDAHRVFDPQTVLDAFAPLRLTEFSLIDDEGAAVHHGASFDEARRCRYGCGLFILSK